MAAGGPSAAPSFVAYYRVSTDQQGRSGLGLDAQRASVAAHVGSAGGRLVDEYEEVESGKRNDRPQLAAALAACRARRATLIVAKIDRLARNAAFLLSVAEGTGENGVVFCDLPQLPPGPIGKFFLTVMAAVAELERGLISERTKAALAQAKAAGRKLGNPRLAAGSRSAGRAGRRSQTERAKQRAADVLPFIGQAQQVLGDRASLRKIAELLTSWSIQPPLGGDRWHAQQVRRVLQLGGETQDIC
jgi:DNA invertase Pin-like site-specific DNA recombinase